MKVLIPRLAALSLLFACGSASPTVALMEETPDGATPETSTSCADLSEKSCLDSSSCTVVPQAEAPRGYLCREAAPPCETDFRQGLDTANDCTAKAGCVFDAGQCYCAPDVVCICGGGPPPRCVAADSQEAGTPSS